MNSSTEISNLVEKLIQDKKRSVIEQGAFVFDIDQTLLPPDVSLEDFPKLIQTLGTFLEKGLRLAFISGSPCAVVKNRILNPLMKDYSQYHKQLFFYVNSGSAHFEVNEHGEFLEDIDYGKEKQISASDLDQVASQLKFYLEQKFNLEDSNFDELIEFWKQKRDKQWSGCEIEFLDFGNSLTYLEDDQMADVKAKKGQAKVSFPFINTRGSQMDANGNRLSVAGFTPTGFYRSEDRDMRDWILEHLQGDLKDTMQRLDMRKAGRSSIDVTAKDVNKAVAVRHLIETQSIAGEFLFYFGDEFYEGGNDQPLLEDSILRELHLAVLAFNQTKPEQDIPWLGVGPEAVHAFLNRIAQENF